MMILTAKVDLKKILLLLAGVSAILISFILAAGRGDVSQTSAPAVSANDGRVRFLESFGWEVSPTPAESGQVLIPQESGEAFRRYNTLQKSQGYDLQEFAGKKVMRYVYEIRNLPEASAPVYATLLVYKNKVIGGDITDTSPDGKVMILRRTTVGG